MHRAACSSSMVVGGGVHHLHGARPAAHSRPVRQEGGRKAGLRRPEHPYPAEDQYLGGYSADLRFLHHHVSGHGGQLYRRSLGANRLPRLQLRGIGSIRSLYVGFIIFFCFFYTAIVFNPVDVADNMKKYGGFIPGIRPGRPTAEYIDKVLSRITLGGAIYVSAVCVLPTFLIQQVQCPLLLRRNRPPDRHRCGNGYVGTD